MLIYLLVLLVTLYAIFCYRLQTILYWLLFFIQRINHNTTDFWVASIKKVSDEA